MTEARTVKFVNRAVNFAPLIKNKQCSLIFCRIVSDVATTNLV